MAVFVDDLIVWAHARGKYKAGACHMCADSLKELHAFAASCGFKRSWYHSGTKLPHYDLTTETRAIAVKAGALEISSRDLVRKFRQRSMPAAPPQPQNT